MTQAILTIWKDSIPVLRRSLAQLLAVHLVYIALGIIVFVPLTGFLGQFLLNLSGQTVLSDLDIAYFFLTPLGMASVILFASLLITILVFEQASLMAVCAATQQKQHIRTLAALVFTVKRAKKIFLFASRLVLRILFIALPFLGLAIAIAWVMLTDYDINYYLSVKPPIFKIAASGIALVLLTMVIVLARNLCSWSLALPLILFTHETPAHSFIESEQLNDGNKQVLLMTLGSWVLSGMILTSFVLGSIQLLGSSLAPFFFDSMPLLVPVLGGLVALWTLGNLFVTTFTSSTFAMFLIHFYTNADGVISTESFADEQQKKKPAFSASLLFIVLPGLVLLAVLVGSWLIDSIPGDNDVMLIAHRGAAGKAPENTIASLRQAIQDGTDWIEIDVQETIDGEVVVIHDSDFMKLANVPMKVWEGTLTEIQQVDVGSWFNADFSSERVPTLEDVLALAKGKCRVLIELKYYGHDLQLEQRVADIVEEAEMVDQVAIMSLKYDAIKAFRAIRPDWPVGLLSTKAIGKISDLDVDFLAINMAAAKPSFIRRIHSSGKQVYVWTINDQISMSRMMALGVDGIITDEPLLAHEIRQNLEDFSPMERLLLHTAVLLKAPIPQTTYRDQSP